MADDDKKRLRERILAQISDQIVIGVLAADPAKSLRVEIVGAQHRLAGIEPVQIAHEQADADARRACRASDADSRRACRARDTNAGRTRRARRTRRTRCSGAPNHTSAT